MIRRLLGLVLVLALTGCAAIPVSGPINTGDVVLTDPGQPIPLANDPPQDAAPEAIVFGFLAASAAGTADQYVVARKYLATGAAAQWEPTERILVYPTAAQPEVELTAEGTAVVRLEVQGSLDASGVYTEEPSGAREELAMELVQDAQAQWRISALDDAVVMSSADFAAYYRRVLLYFVSLDSAYLVPDPRWLPASGALNNAMRALLAGPSDWLRDVVRTGAPEGTRLGPGGVGVTADQIATVDLTAAASAADPVQRDLLIAQVRATLERVPGTALAGVVVTAGAGEPWVSSGDVMLVRDPQPQEGPYVVADDQLQVLEDDALVPIATGELPADVDALALSLDGSTRVVLGSDALVRLTDGGPPTVLLAGGGLVAPSVDRFGWTWTAQPGGEALLAVSPEGEIAAVAADWLVGVGVRSLAVSRDGSRVAVVHATGDAAMVDLAAVLRDESGRPQALGAARQEGATLTDASQVLWVDEATLAVLGTSGSLVAPALHLVPLGGQTSALPLVEQTTVIAAGRGDRSLYLVDGEGALLWRQAAAWVPVAEGVQVAAFPG